MAQNGFAFFFLLLILGSAVTMLLSVVESWPLVVSAVVGAEPTPVVRRYRSTRLRPIDVPEVAARLLLGQMREPTRVVRAVRVHPARIPPFNSSPRQLRFRFA